VLDPVRVLEQRRDFLEGIVEVAETCNWTADDITTLYDCLWKDLVEIDNAMLSAYEKTGDETYAREIWESRMEDLRHWLGMILGVKIRYI